MNWVKEFDDQVKNMVDESNSKETAQYWKKRNILSIHSLCTRGVQNIRLTRQSVRPTTNPSVSCGSLNQAVWVRRVRLPKLRIELGYGLKNCQPATTRPTRLINNFTYIKNIYILVEIVKYLKLINSPNKFLQLINHQFRKQNWPSKNSLNKI